jgi:hypothetical protein
MHRVARELAHQECGWKHSEGHGVVALDYEGVRHVGLDKMCLLMEVRQLCVLRSSVLSWYSDVLCALEHIHSPHTRVCCLRYVAG